MSNPAPTLNQINAFNATQGTTIDFNIIGGTEVIRSNKIYIYDLSDNSLICTHLYVSTESIHELPPNTSSSIVYASGKSSADFTNNTQYYAQIQTFTDVGGTQGGSGLSIAKLFWCLPTPTLTLSTIPTTISTTSYNVSATYTPNTSGSATNEIQEFQFNLYSAIGALLQTSGVVLYGEGVDLSYNFSGLEVDSTYYVTLDVTTTQGMNVSAQSNTFTVSIDTPTMGSASVVNNGCDGYISVTSNLSSEYEHEESVEAGEIMSFTTDSVNDITELDVDFSPVQDGTPWMSAQDTEPYMFRAVPSQTEDFGHESDTIVGGTVAWNQLVQDGNFPDGTTKWSSSGSSFVIADNKATISKAGVTSGYIDLTIQTNPAYRFNYYSNHKYYCVATVQSDNRVGWYIGSAAGAGGFPYAQAGVFSTKKNIEIIWQPANDGVAVCAFRCYTGNNVTADLLMTVENVNVIDLTQMFGSTIADYIYSLETANAGAGVAWFRKLFPKPYYAYNAGELMSVQASSHDMVGFNAFDGEVDLGGCWTETGTYQVIGGGYMGAPNKIKCLPNTTYCFTASNITVQGFLYYAAFDANGNYISRPYGTAIPADTKYGTFTTPSDCYFIGWYLWRSTAFTNAEAEDITINISWDGERDGEYEAYVKHSYPLDSDLTLRGIPKLDASNNLYYDGDTYESDGTVTRKYGIVDLGTLNWILSGVRFYVQMNVGSSPIAAPALFANTQVGNVLCKDYTTTDRNTIESKDRAISLHGDSGASFFTIVDSRYSTAADLKAALSGVYLIYELATPTTETADPYTNPQIVDPSGTEEYVGSPIPVGHKTTYQRICPITGWTGCEVSQAGANLWSDKWSEYTQPNDYRVHPIKLEQGAKYTVSVSKVGSTVTGVTVGIVKSGDRYSNFVTPSPWVFVNNQGAVQTGTTYTIDATWTDPKLIIFATDETAFNSFFENYHIQIEKGTTATPYTPYNGQSYSVSWQTEAGTVYGGTVDLVTGVLTAYLAETTYDGSNDEVWGRDGSNRYYIQINAMKRMSDYVGSMYCDKLPTIKDHNVLLSQKGISGYVLDSSYQNQNWVYTAIENVNSVAELRTWLNANPIQVVYPLATPTEIQLTPQQMQTLSGQNNIWSNTNGGMYLVYQLPITSLLVKRRDVADISGKWLTLYSTPINQASDMDFTFIDFLNQYGKTYQYALVPVLAQNQSGVIVQIEGGYTVSDNVDSIFDGVYIADQTNVERVKAGVGYGNIDMNQGVGSITPIGSKYPIVITNSQNQYHNGSVRGTIVPNDFYSNGNLSRIDMVNKRDELEQFLTNKRAKIIKDWNGKMWLVMIMSNVACSFDDNYGMGMVSFSADWLEVGDPTNQQDLYNAGLINVGGV